jgi:hypothetical protein
LRAAKPATLSQIALQKTLALVYAERGDPQSGDSSKKPLQRSLNMANKSQDKGKAKNNKPKLTAKQKKEKKLKKALEGKNRYDA